MALAALAIAVTLTGPLGNLVYAALTNEQLPPGVAAVVSAWPIALVVGLIAGVLGILLARSAARREWDDQFVAIGPAVDLKPQQFGFGGESGRPFVPFLRPRILEPTQDDPYAQVDHWTLIQAVLSGQSVVVQGDAHSGKSRLLLEICWHLLGWSVLMPGAAFRWKDPGGISRFRGKRCLLVLDSAESIVPYPGDIPDLYAHLAAVAKSVVVLAGIRIGEHPSSAYDTTVARLLEEAHRHVYLMPLSEGQQSTVIEHDDRVRWEAERRRRDERLDSTVRAAATTLPLLARVAMAEVNASDVTLAAGLLESPLAREIRPSDLDRLAVGGYLLRSATPGLFRLPLATLELAEHHERPQEQVLANAVEGWFERAMLDHDPRRFVPAFVVLLGAHRHSDIAQWAEPMVALRPSRWLWELLGHAKIHLDAFQATLDCLDAADTFPGEPAFPPLRGTALLKLGRLDEAAAAFSSELVPRPRNAALWVGLGLADLARRRHEEAIGSLSKAMFLAPSPLTYGSYGLALLEAARDEEGCSALERCLELWPSHELAGALWKALAERYDRLGRWPDVERCVRKLVDLTGEPEERLRLVLLMMKNDRVEEAVMMSRLWVRAEPDRAEAALGLGMALSGTHERLGNQDAIEWLCRAWSMREKLPPARTQLISGILELLGSSPAECPDGQDRLLG